MMATARKADIQKELADYCRQRKWRCWKLDDELSIVAADKGRVIWVRISATKDMKPLLSLDELGHTAWLQIQSLREFTALY